MGKPISKALEDAITERSSVFANGNDKSRIPVTQEQREPLYSQIMQPIISAGDTIGSVLLLGKNERDVMGESEKMLIRTASGFLGRHERKKNKNKLQKLKRGFRKILCLNLFYFRVVVGRRSHRYASFLRLEIRKFILQDCFKNQLVGTLAAEDSFCIIRSSYDFLELLWQ